VTWEGQALLDALHAMNAVSADQRERIRGLKSQSIATVVA
jgi:hypothetical protein